MLLTARAFGVTEKLLEARGASAQIVGGEYGRSRVLKGWGTIRRARQLTRLCSAWGRPTLVLHSSRGAALASRYLGLSQIVIVDYEHVDLSVYRHAGCTLAFPDVIPAEFFKSRGFPQSRLLPFGGLKEDISFSSVDLGRFKPNGAHKRGISRLLVRPPSESGHYYREGSGVMTQQFLAFLAPRDDIHVHLVPRHRDQGRYLQGLQWANQPVLIDEPKPFPAILADIDGVISAGGTMLREAAYLGIPAFSTFQGPSGAVDQHLEKIGRLQFISSPRDFQKLDAFGLARQAPLMSQPGIVSQFGARMIEAAGGSASMTGAGS